MDENRFYGKRKVVARPIPDKSDDSELSSVSDEEGAQEGGDALEQSSSSEDSSIDDEEVVLLPGGCSGARPPRPRVWRDRAPAAATSTEPTFTWPEYDSDGVKRPVEYFNELFHDAIKDNIVEQSNLYATQVNPNKLLGLDIATLERFVGIRFPMSVTRMSRARMYWSQRMRFPKIADVMPLARWGTVMRLLHINDNEDRFVRSSMSSLTRYEVSCLERRCPQTNNSSRSKGSRGFGNTTGRNLRNGDRCSCSRVSTD